jgi:predicted dehydrogenase
MKSEFRVALVGAGRWGRAYINTIAGLEGVRLAAIASRNPETAGLAPADCRICTDWRDAIDAGMVDAVIVATPPASHAAITRASIEAGLPALVEKPLTLDLDEAVKLRALSAERNVFVMVDHTHLFNPAFRALKQELRNDGPIAWIEGEAGNSGPYRSDTTVLWDWGPHDIAMCLDLLGCLPVRVGVTRLEQRMIGGVRGENLSLELGFLNGVTARLGIGNLQQEKRRRFAVHTHGGALLYDDLAAHKLTRFPPQRRDSHLNGAGEPVAIASRMPLEQALLDFVSGARADSCDFASLDLGVDVVRVLDWCQKELSSHESPLS